jgi:hypothetical protein
MKKMSFFMSESKEKKHFHTHYKSISQPLLFICSQNSCKICFIEWEVNKFPRSTCIPEMEVKTVVTTNKRSVSKDELYLFLHRPKKMNNPKQQDVVKHRPVRVNPLVLFIQWMVISIIMSIFQPYTTYVCQTQCVLIHAHLNLITYQIT